MAFKEAPVMRRESIGKLGAVIALGLLASVPALAQAPKPNPAPASASRAATTSNLPYDITADQQEMFNEEHRTVYRGNVVVIQGTDRLNTPQLTLLFAPKTPAGPGKPAAPVAAAAPSATSTFGKIRQMEAEGPVYFTTPTQNAKGDHGTYLASDDTITLIGNVVLVQNKDVSTGDKLVINRTTDHYTLYKKNDQGGRVRGVFYQDEPAAGQATAAGKTPAAPTPKPAAARP
jgi:lipopolysaccharide export system protein LptA